MESWMQMDREYPVGTSGNAMTNLRWINGAASKGLKSANADSKDATQTGAYMSLAKFVNTKLSLKQPWTVDTAMTKWKNMKTSFKRICKDNQFPVDAEWYAQGKTKEELATECERITAIRKQKCASYDVLWAELQSHPSINPPGRFESPHMQGVQDAELGAESEGSEGDSDSILESVKERLKQNRVPAPAKSATSTTRSELEDADLQSPQEAGRRRTTSAAASPRKEVQSPKKKVPPAKAEKFKFKKGSDAPRHRDITSAYIAMKAEWNRMWLRVQILKERREVYFVCRDAGWTPAATKAAFDDIGLGKVPAYLPSWGEDPMAESFGGVPEHDPEFEFRGQPGVERIINDDDDDAASFRGDADDAAFQD